MTTYSAINVDKFVKLTTFCFQIHIEMQKVVEVFPNERQECPYLT